MALQNVAEALNKRRLSGMTSVQRLTLHIAQEPLELQAQVLSATRAPRTHDPMPVQEFRGIHRPRLEQRMGPGQLEVMDPLEAASALASRESRERVGKKVPDIKIETEYSECKPHDRGRQRP